MEQSAAPPPPVPDEDAVPATRGDLRSVRRWLVVAGVWAAAATAVGVIALIKATDQPSSDSRADVARQIGQAERALDRRIDSLRSQIDTLPSSQDLSRVDNRLKRAEEDAKRASTDQKTTSSKLDDLTKRVDDLAGQQTSTTPSPQGNSGGK
jgi:septal ring factor EnvC (AmiA/AmiB activator)